MEPSVFLNFLILLTILRSTYGAPPTTSLPTTIEAEETVSPPATTTSKPAKPSTSGDHGMFVDHHLTTGHHGFVDHTQQGYPSFVTNHLPTEPTYFEPNSPVVYRTITEPNPSLGQRGYFDANPSGRYTTFTEPPRSWRNPPRQKVRHFIYIEPSSSGGFGGFTGPPPLSGGYRILTESPSYGGYRGYTEPSTFQGKQVLEMTRQPFQQQANYQLSMEKERYAMPSTGNNEYIQANPSTAFRSFNKDRASMGSQFYVGQPPSAPRHTFPERPSPLPQQPVKELFSSTGSQNIRKRPSLIAQESVRNFLSTGPKIVREPVLSSGRQTAREQSPLATPSPAMERQTIVKIPTSFGHNTDIKIRPSQVSAMLNNAPASGTRLRETGSSRRTEPVRPRPKMMVEPPPSSGSVFGECLIFRRYQSIPKDYQCMKGRRAMYCRYSACPPLADFPCAFPRMRPGEKCLSCPGMCVFNGEIVPADPEPLPSLDMVNHCVCTNFGLRCTKKRARDLQAFCAV